MSSQLSHILKEGKFDKIVPDNFLNNLLCYGDPLNGRTDSEVLALGKGGSSKTDEFLEKFQTAFDPPPSFSENHVALFFRNT